MIRCEQSDGVRLLTIERPEAANAIDAATAGELVARLGDADRVRAIVLTGSGKNFSYGLDVAAMGDTLGAMMADGALARPAPPPARPRRLPARPRRQPK